MIFRKTLWYFLYYWRPSWIFCVIVDQVLEHEIPQNKNGILNRKVKFVCPLCTQTWCIILIIETLSAILAAILFFNFERGRFGTSISELCETTAWQILLRNALQTLRMPLFEKWALTIVAYENIYMYRVYVQRRTKPKNSYSIKYRLA